MDVEQLKAVAVANADAIIEYNTQYQCEMQLANALGFIQAMQHSIAATRKNAIYECILIARDVRSYATRESAAYIDLVMADLNKLLIKYQDTK